MGIKAVEFNSCFTEYKQFCPAYFFLIHRDRLPDNEKGRKLNLRSWSPGHAHCDLVMSLRRAAWGTFEGAKVGDQERERVYGTRHTLPTYQLCPFPPKEPINLWLPHWMSFISFICYHLQKACQQTLSHMPAEGFHDQTVKGSRLKHVEISNKND